MIQPSGDEIMFPGRRSHDAGERFPAVREAFRAEAERSATARRRFGRTD